MPCIILIGAIMETSRRKKVTMILVGVFFVAAWIASYPPNNGNATTTVATTSIGGQTVFVSGLVNGTITGYANTSTISLSGGAANRSGAVSALLTSLKADGSIYDFEPYTNSFRVYNASLGLYALQGMVYNAVADGTSVNVTRNVTIGSTMHIGLPQFVLMYAAGQPLEVRLNNYSLGVSRIIKIGSTVRLRVHAVSDLNGTVSNMTLSIA